MPIYPQAENKNWMIYHGIEPVFSIWRRAFFIDYPWYDDAGYCSFD